MLVLRTLQAAMHCSRVAAVSADAAEVESEHLKAARCQAYDSSAEHACSGTQPPCVAAASRLWHAAAHPLRQGHCRLPICMHRVCNDIFYPDGLAASCAPLKAPQRETSLLPAAAGAAAAAAAAAATAAASGRISGTAGRRRRPSDPRWGLSAARPCGTPPPDASPADQLGTAVTHGTHMRPQNITEQQHASLDQHRCSAAETHSRPFCDDLCCLCMCRCWTELQNLKSGKATQHSEHR